MVHRRTNLGQVRQTSSPAKDYLAQFSRYDTGTEVRFSTLLTR